MSSIQEKSGRLTIIVNRAAGFVSVHSDYHSTQCDRSKLKEWIEFYRCASAGRSGQFYTAKLRAFRRALELLDGAEVKSC